MQKTTDMSYDHVDFARAMARLRAASYSADQALYAAGVSGEDAFDVVCAKLRTNIEEAGHSQPFMTTEPNWLAYTTASGRNKFGFSYEKRESDGCMVWKAWIEVPMDRTSTLAANCVMEVFIFDDRPEVFEGYDSNEAEKRLVAAKAAEAFRLDRGQVYDMLQEQVEAKRAARLAILDEDGEPITMPFEKQDDYSSWDDEGEDDDESYLGASTLAKLRDAKLFDEDDEE